MRRTIVAGVIVWLITLVLSSISIIAWEKTTDGSLIKALGGAVIENLQCTALPSENEEAQRQCIPDQFKLVQWCSGNCDTDDARVTICCDQ